MRAVHAQQSVPADHEEARSAPWQARFEHAESAFFAMLLFWWVYPHTEKDMSKWGGY